MAEQTMSDGNFGEPRFASGVVANDPDGIGQALTLSDESHLSKLVVRADGGTPAAAAMGVPFGSSRTDGDAFVLGMRPEEWVVLGAAAAVEEVAARLDTTGHVSVIDHTHSRALFRLTGVDGARLLEKVCSLDLSDPMTPDGAVVSASVAKVTCDMSRHDVDGVRSYLIACDRSFAQYLFDALLDAGSEFDIGAVA